jgi:hypothetical protein
MIMAWAVLHFSERVALRFHPEKTDAAVRMQADVKFNQTIQDYKKLPKQTKWDAENRAKWAAFLKLPKPTASQEQSDAVKRALEHQAEIKKQAKLDEDKRRKKRKKKLEELAKKKSPKITVEVLAEDNSKKFRPTRSDTSSSQTTVSAFAAPSPTPSTQSRYNQGAGQSKFDVSKLIQKIMSTPSRADLNTLIQAFQMGMISQAQYTEALLSIQKSPVAEARKLAMIGADIVKSPESFEVLALGTIDPDSVVQEEAQKRIDEFQNIYQFPVLMQVYSSGTLISRIRASDILNTSAQNYASDPATTREQRVAFQPFVEVLSPIAKSETSSELKQSATKALRTINELLKTVVASTTGSSGSSGSVVR